MDPLIPKNETLFSKEVKPFDIDSLLPNNGQAVRIGNPTEFLSTVKFQERPETPILISPSSSTSPSIKNTNNLQLSSTSSVLITDFLYGQEGQQITVLGDGFSTVDYGTKIKTNTGVDKLLLANQTYTFTLFNGVWIEASAPSTTTSYPPRRVDLISTTPVTHTHGSNGTEDLDIIPLAVADLTNMTKVRLHAYLSWSGGGTLKLMYSTDGASWTDVTGGQITITGGSPLFFLTAIGTLNTLARIATCYLKIVRAGNIGNTIAVSSCAAEFTE